MFSFFSRKPGGTGGAGATGGGSVTGGAGATVGSKTDLKKNGVSDPLFSKLGPIIEATAATPTITNDASNFVVITYWWGKGNLNKNVARPCLDFYEQLLMRPVNVITSNVIFTHEELAKKIEWRTFLLSERFGLKKFYHDSITKYLRERGDIPHPRSAGYNEATYNAQWSHYLRSVLEIINAAFTDPMIDAYLRELLKARANYNEAVTTQEALLATLSVSSTIEKENIKDVLKEMKRAIEQKTKLATDAIKTEMRKYIFGAKAGERPVPFLEGVLMYKAPITYDQMIANWEAQCTAVGCNFMAVEYPEFARPGGYQLAINAKPLFIQKALEICAPRAVLYIDGDMKINAYPPIFDMEDIDYMARGWQIDPRSSWKHTNGDINVDPYVFETSGGIMYFSQTPESKRLLNEWVYYSSLPTEKGKADDRIISLLFNTLELLAPMKIIQLPIEYLWLSMDYNDTVEEIDREKLFVEHPECLTSEDTASSGGAAGDRSPTLYKVLEQFSQKRSEDLYESVLFPTPALVESFRPYINYLNRDDVIYQERFLEDAVTEELANEKPFYIYPFGTFGRKQAIYDANIAKALSGPDICHGTWYINDAYENACVMNKKEFTIPNILQQLSRGRTIVYQPNGEDSSFKMIDTLLKDSTKSRLEFVFFEKRTRFDPANRLNFVVDLNKAMIIRFNKSVPLEGRLPPLFTMFALLENVGELETVFQRGYQFLSLIRCHAATLLTHRAATGGGTAKATRRRKQRGGGRSDKILGTDAAITFLYGPIQSNNRRRTARRRRGKN